MFDHIIILSNNSVLENLMHCAEMVLWNNTKPLCDWCKSIDNTTIAHFQLLAHNYLVETICW